MKLESLKNGKFEKNILSKSAMMMLDGGKTVQTNANGTDSLNYHCSGPKGDLFDITATDPAGESVTISSPTMFDGTDSTWYN